MPLVIAITGATGFIGHQLAQYLLNQGHHIVELGRQSIGLEHFISLDHDNNEIVRLLQLNGVTHLIHLAGFAHRAGDAAHYENDNLALTQRIIQLANQANIERLLYMSSVKVLGNRTKTPFTNASQPNPTDIYGKSKLSCEQAVESKLTCDWVIVRPPLVYGESAKGNIAKMRNWCAAGRPFPFGGLDNRRSLISIGNLNSFVLCCLMHSKAVKKKWLISDGKSRSTAEIYLLANQTTKPAPKLIGMPKALWRLLTYTAQLSPLIESLVTNLEVDIADTQQTLNWQPHDN